MLFVSAVHSCKLAHSTGFLVLCFIVVFYALKKKNTWSAFHGGALLHGVFDDVPCHLCFRMFVWML